MAHRELTDRFCQTAKAAEGKAQTDYWDAGCKGLALRVSRSGAKTWSYVFAWGNGRARMKLGTYPATSLARAHTLADEVRADLEAGTDPRAGTQPETLRAICEEYLSREAGNLRSGDQRRAVLERLVYPTLGGRPIGDIRRSEIVRWLDGIEDERGPAMADKALGFVRRVFNWYATRSDDFRSPIVRGMSRTKPRERARARVLTDDEIRMLWAVAKAQGAFGRLVRFLLLTGARRTEAAAMPWGELEGRDWTLPGARNKTKLELLRPLAPAALAVLGAKPTGATFVFSTDGGATPISGYSKLKLTFDKACGVTDYTIHDLRRTARSLMSRAGVPSDHAERCLGHVIGGVRGTYDRYEYRDEKARAQQALARLIDRIVTGRPTVVTLQRVDANG